MADKHYRSFAVSYLLADDWQHRHHDHFLFDHGKIEVGTHHQRR